MDKIIKLKCNHCGKEIEYNNTEPGNFKKLYNETGFSMIPLTTFSSAVGPLYCNDCVVLIYTYFEWLRRDYGFTSKHIRD
ncbi:MAG TPA: hypothetical protein P5136_00500 [Methanofastidiosum sp.]|nr:hypothetical protein [Methanofastidiosum sp.]